MRLSTIALLVTLAMGLLAAPLPAEAQQAPTPGLDVLATVGILLSLISGTLAVTALVFGWVTFRNTSKMQMDAQAILAKVSEKVDVIVERTSHQLDRAWDYFTGQPPVTASRTTQEAERQALELKEQLKREVMDALKETVVDKKAFDGLVEHVESVVSRSTERAAVLARQQVVLQQIDEIEAELRQLAATSTDGKVTRGPLTELAKLIQPRLVPGALQDVERLADFRDLVAQRDFQPPLELVQRALAGAERLLSYLRRRHRARAGADAPPSRPNWRSEKEDT